jgi:hypothetical protein
MQISQNDWYASFLIPNLKATADKCLTEKNHPELAEAYEESVKIISYHINDLYRISGIVPGKFTEGLNVGSFNDYYADQAKKCLDTLSKVFRLKNKGISEQRNSLYNQIESVIGSEEFLKLRNNHHNEALADIVLNRTSSNKIYNAGDRFIQKADPVYMFPGSKWGRAHFYSPYKQIGNIKINTLLFNILIIWIMIISLFVALYYNLLKRFISLLESLKLPILRKYGREMIQV